MIRWICKVLFSPAHLANEQGGKTYLCDYGVLGNVTVFVPEE